MIIARSDQQTSTTQPREKATAGEIGLVEPSGFGVTTSVRGNEYQQWLEKSRLEHEGTRIVREQQK
jgi:hypothetical protein